MAEGQTQTVKISGELFTIPAPFAEGQPLTAIQAKVLNQTFAENVRNNVAGKIKNLPEGASLDTTIAEGENAGKSYRSVFQAYADSYEFTERGAGGGREPVDPVEREAKRIATDTINAKLAAQGAKKKDLADGAFDAAVEKLMASPAVLDEAKRRVKQKEKIGGDALDLNELGLG